MFNQDLFIDFSLALFAFVNPLYTVPVFVAMTQGFNNAERLRTSLIAAATMFCVLMLTVIVGDQVLLIFGINLPSFKIAGGLIILGLAFKMLFLNPDKNEDPAQSSQDMPVPPKKDIGVYPLTIPVLAGPGLFTTAIVFSSELTTLSDFAAICAVAVVTALQYWLSMIFAGVVTRYLNNTTIQIGTNVLGILLAAVSVELMLSGVEEFVLSIQLPV